MVNFKSQGKKSSKSCSLFCKAVLFKKYSVSLCEFFSFYNKTFESYLGREAMMNSCEDSFDFPPCGGGGGDGGDSSSRSDTDSQTSEASPEHDLCEPSLNILLQISKRLSTIYLQPSSVIFHGSYSIPLVNIAESHDKVR